MEEETKVIGNPKPEMEEVTKKKKKRNNKKNKNKKEVEESKEVIEREDNQDNHEDLLKLLTQNDNSLFEKLLNITPDFTKFDEIQFKFNEQIKSMNVLMNDIFSGNYEKIPDEEENNGSKANTDEKNLDPKRKKVVSELREKIGFFNQKIQTLDKMQNGNDELEKEMISLIRTNLLDDIKTAEDLLLAIINSQIPTF